MAKSKRKRKLKEEDFKKKKLKVGKRLPMPDNVTKTSFKAGSIHIQQRQQTIGGDQPKYKRHTVKDLLNSCAHYNTQAREEALLGLKDIFEKHRNALTDSLNEILQRTLDKVIDIESTVRRAALSLFWCIFKLISTTEITPFFPHIVAYLCSAMTHINEGIQMDSMKFLDHCINFYPELLRGHSKNIIQNFIDVISSEKTNGGSVRKSGISKGSTLRAKVTSQKMQLEVLTRLNKLLQVVFPVKVDGDGNISTSIAGESGIGGDRFKHGGSSGGLVGSTGINVGRFGGGTIDGGIGISGGGGEDNSVVGAGTFGGRNATTNVKSFGSYGDDENIHIPCAFRNVERTLVSDFSTTTSLDLLGNDIKLKEFIASLSPVLFEYWIECCPVEFVMNLVPVQKTSISLQIMKEILEIFLTLIGNLKRIVSDKVFNSFIHETLFEQFTTQFLTVFPMSFTLQQSKKKKGPNQTISDIMLNLSMCELFSFFMFGIEEKFLPKWVHSVSDYLCKVLQDKSKGSNSTIDNVKSLLKLVNVFLLNIPDSLKDVKVELLKNVFQFFEASHAMSNIKKILLKFLEDVLRGHNCVSLELKNTLDLWLCSLQKLLANKEVTVSVIYNIFMLWKMGMVQNYLSICQYINRELPSFFNSTMFERLDKETQCLIIEILFHTGQAPSRELFEAVSTLCNSHCLSLDVFQYLAQVLHLLSNPEQVTSVCGETRSNYLSFVLSVLAGETKEKLTSLQVYSNNKSFSHYVCSNKLLLTGNQECYNLLTDDQEDCTENLKKAWYYQKSITDTVCQYVVLSSHSEHLVELLAHPLTKLFGQYKSLPLTVVYRILCLIKTVLPLAQDVEPIAQNLQLHLANWCNLIWHFILSPDVDTECSIFFKSITKDLTEVLMQLARISVDVLKKMVNLLQSCTLLETHKQTLTCKVLTEMLKCGILKDYKCKSDVENIKNNLEQAFNAEMVESQIFFNFKSQYSLFMLNETG